MKENSKRCTVCNHPLRAQIEGWYADHSLRQIQRLVEEGTPSLQLSVRALQNHKTIHYKAPPEEPTLPEHKIVVTGLAPELIEALAASAPTPDQFFKAVMNIAYQNALANPKRVSTAQGVIAAQELKKGTPDGDDFEKFWDAVNKKLKEGKRGNKALPEPKIDWELPEEGEFTFDDAETQGSESDQ